MQYSFLIILLVFMIVMMFVQSRKAKQQQQEKQNFYATLEPGTEVITIGGVIGKVVSVDEEYEEIVIDSEGSHLRFTFKAVSRAYVRPAFVHDDEVDENGNPLPQDSPEPSDSEPEQIESAEVVETSTEGLPYGAREVEESQVEATTDTEESSADQPSKADQQ
ncbi:preprotein translocase subunit YajC [Bifidobacterium gallicum]|uniref:Preprotein translocase subunit YajC n=1 Tax=Bifidobacterium gallicum DSM 20093 = LMG 11596 TaxID=561180 RepID=D1NTL7_9BIFI|nr:preprotein translocase subunit YajC [Bifidobacterium gallicum]EFA23071.1 preprotein translocase, YajC subunit [Bifidobacterium gallicum DSM 20093 = LMG 11596]KFI58757.1 preprotein translocase subunit YajC [Bifidobacterium gallicum DSM 20093 = LMG 11596]